MKLASNKSKIQYKVELCAHTSSEEKTMVTKATSDKPMKINKYLKNEKQESTHLHQDKI